MERRRSVMQPTADPYNARSGIPPPSTVSKPGPLSRMSVAGTGLRPPSNMAPPSTNPRHSVMRSSQNQNPLLMSASKPNPNVGRTPMSSSVRRGSMWPGAAPAPIGTQTVKDSRPLRDKSYQSKMRQDVYNYLNSSGFEIAPGTLTSISGKDYKAIFETLVLTIDPYYPFVEGAKLEEEFVPALRALRYPFSQLIDQRWLAAVASPHSWPSLLGVLHWLVEVCKMRDDYLSSGDPTIQDPTNIPDEFDDILDHKALAFQYCEASYDVWMSMQDQFTEPNRILEERYNRNNLKIQNEVEELKKKYAAKKTEYQNLKTCVPDLTGLQKNIEQARTDKNKWDIILPKKEERIKRTMQDIAREKVQLERQSEQIAALTLELQNLRSAVSAQTITQEEARRLKTEGESLSHTIQELSRKISETDNTMLSLEVTLSNRIAAAEDALDNYNYLLESLDLYPVLPEPWEGINLRLELNTATPNPQEMLAGPDFATVIKPTLNDIANSKRVERAAIESERIKVDNELDLLTTECENLDYEIAELERKVANLNEQAEAIREASQAEALEASSQSNSLARELALVRQQAASSGLIAKTRLQKLQFSYKEQMEKVNKLKEDTVRAILKNSQDIALFKEEVSRHLQELRNFTETDS